jgi:hypothetical protein
VFIILGTKLLLLCDVVQQVFLPKRKQLKNVKATEEGELEVSVF